MDTAKHSWPKFQMHPNCKLRYIDQLLLLLVTIRILCLSMLSRKKCITLTNGRKLAGLESKI